MVTLRHSSRLVCLSSTELVGFSKLEVMNFNDALKQTSDQIKIHLKEKQIEAISSFCSGHDVFVSLPTGYGKSLIYAMLPSMFDKMRGTVVTIEFRLYP